MEVGNREGIFGLYEVEYATVDPSGVAVVDINGESLFVGDRIFVAPVGFDEIGAEGRAIPGRFFFGNGEGALAFVVDVVESDFAGFF